MSDEVIELIGTETPTGSIRVRLDLELPHEQAMQILATVHDYKDRKQKEEEAARRREEAERRKAEAAARKAAKAEAAKVKKPAPAKDAATKGDAEKKA
ncbi:hypothetical protein [Pacificispira sp.]|jgi:hypothetical protein|uniref:hypothetical protein n=1 Tax=Pacificispira sp. TaxID=2888761 RepID=UPI003BA8F985